MALSRTVVAALADTLFPAGPDAPAGSVIVPDALDDLTASLPEDEVKELSMGLTMIELGAIPLHGRRFSKLGESARERYIAGWMRSRVPLRRTVYRALRVLFGNLYYADERTWALIGYDGPQVQRRGERAE